MGGYKKSHTLSSPAANQSKSPLVLVKKELEESFQTTDRQQNTLTQGTHLLCGPYPLLCATAAAAAVAAVAAVSSAATAATCRPHHEATTWCMRYLHLPKLFHNTSLSVPFRHRNRFKTGGKDDEPLAASPAVARPNAMTIARAGEAMSRDFSRGDSRSNGDKTMCA